MTTPPPISSAAVQAGVPVFPVALRGALRAVLPAGCRLPSPGGISVSVGEPIMPLGKDWAAA
ncbi:MAG: hypothetical protein H7338_02320 [Candidatus Sericytochromatia bacterium]|nr:hypothetical protein [Candidatus Sericytochromatia bacterium]